MYVLQETLAKLMEDAKRFPLDMFYLSQSWQSRDGLNIWDHCVHKFKDMLDIKTLHAAKYEWQWFHDMFIGSIMPYGSKNNRKRSKNQ